MRIIRLSILLFVIVSVAGLGSDHIEGFRFKVRLFDAAKHSKKARLRRGYLLKAIHPTDRGVTYQTVVLCKDLDLDFDAQGLSREVEVVGFCFGPGQAIPIDKVEWWVPGLFSVTVRDYGCTKATIQKVRQEQMTPGPAMSEDKPVDTCTGSETKCMDKFSSWLKLKYGISYLEASEGNICDLNPSRGDIDVVYELFCDAALLAAAKTAAP